MNYFEQIEAMHSLVRDYVEKEEPEYKVTSIDGYAMTAYAPPLGQEWDFQPDYLHVNTQLRFRVSGVYRGAQYNRKLSCQVHITSDGQLFMGDRLVSR